MLGVGVNRQQARGSRIRERTGLGEGRGPLTSSLLMNWGPELAGFPRAQTNPDPEPTSTTGHAQTPTQPSQCSPGKKALC